MSLAVTPMGEGHLDRLAELEALCFSQPWSREALAEEIGNPNACFLVCMDGPEILGYGGMHFAWGEFYMDNLAVFPRYRRRGAARALLVSLMDFARRRGGDFLTLEVRPSNGAAVALYKSLGFSEVGRRKGFYSQPQEDALLLRLDIVTGRKGDAPC